MERKDNLTTDIYKYEYDNSNKYLDVYKKLKKDIVDLINKDNVDVKSLIDRLQITEEIFYDYMVEHNYKNFAIYLDTILTINEMKKEVNDERIIRVDKNKN